MQPKTKREKTKKMSRWGGGEEGSCRKRNINAIESLVVANDCSSGIQTRHILRSRLARACQLTCSEFLESGLVLYSFVRSLDTC